MKILFLSNIATPYQLDFLEELNKQDDVKAFGYFLFAKEKNRNWSLELPSYCEVNDHSYTIKDYYRLYKYLKQKKISHLLLGGYSLPMTFWIILLTKLFNINLYIWSERPINYYTGIKQILKDIYIKIVFLNIEKMFAIGKLAVKIFEKYHRNVVNLPYSMNLEKLYSIQRDNNNETINFLFSGQYIDRKNIINTINAFKSIISPNIRLNLIGGGELQEEVLELIKDDKRIAELGFIQPDKLSEIYSKNDVFLMPSKHDGWALVVNEAMASGMPIISTDKVGAVVEYIRHKENGFICDISENSIKEGISFYINNMDLIVAHGNKNINIIKSALGDVKNAAKFLLNELR